MTTSNPVWAEVIQEQLADAAARWIGAPPRRRPADQFAASMDVVVAEHLAATFNTRYLINERQSGDTSGATWRCGMADKLKAGDLVLVRSGLRETEARVLEVFGPNDSHLLLAIPIHGAEGEVLDERTVSLPVRRVVRRLTAA